jgi:hypothetical protein
MFDINKIKNKKSNNQYDKRISHLKSQKGWDTNNIEQTIDEVYKNIFEDNCRSLVIYGEPQSGKTEMMIALTAKLLDHGKKHILLLVTDNVKLRDQNLKIFATSGISPVPIDNYAFLRSVKESKMDIRKNPYVVFCKKNASELRRLVADTGLHEVDDLIIIDDEADYASPNSKINKINPSNMDEELKSVINELITKIMNANGIWLGVTATPGRLDLNNSFANNNKRWVYLPPHDNYYGQYSFFPIKYKKEGISSCEFNIKTLGETGDDPSYLKEAAYSFLVTVAKRNIESLKKNGEEGNYSMIIHTSTGKEGHRNDFLVIDEKIFKPLKEDLPGYEKILKNIYDIALKKYQDPDLANQIYVYVYENKHRYKSVIMNSDKDLRSQDFDSGTDPTTPFTFIFGGNIISRGLTFHNLLSMFFSRDAKHKLDKGTYVQRARMFGNRKEIFKDFELTIPHKLYHDWWTVFQEHRLDLATINRFEEPMWHSSKRTKTTQEASIDKANVIEKKGEIYWGKFKLTKEIEDLYLSMREGNKIEKIKRLYKILGSECFHRVFYEELINDNDAKDDDNIYVQNIRDITKDKYGDNENIVRTLGGHIDGHSSGAEYWFAMFRNDKGEARLFYRPYFNRKVLSHPRMSS